MIKNLINMWENTAMIKSMGKVNLHGNPETFTKATMSKMKEMVMGKCTLMMELFIKETGSVDCRQALL